MAEIKPPDAFGSTLEKESGYDESDWRKRLQRADCITFVALTGEFKAVGLIVGAPYDVQAGLYAMWVDKNQRRMGLGGALIDSVVEWSRDRQCSKLILDVGDFNLAAIGLYESKGFIKTGVVGTLPHPRNHITEHQRALYLKS